MKKLAIIVGLLMVPGLALAAHTPTATPTMTPSPSTTPSCTPTPTPAGYKTPTPPPSPTPSPIPGNDIVLPTEGDPISLYADWTATTTDSPLKWTVSNKYFTVPSGRMLEITSIEWSCQSAAQGVLEWNGAYFDLRIDKVCFPADGQGKVWADDVGRKLPPYAYRSLSPCLTVDNSTGTVMINGILR